MPRQMGGAGYALLDLNNLEYLKQAVGLLRWLGFPVGKSTSVSYGGGGYGQYGRLIFDGDGGGSGSSDEDDRYQTGYGGGFGGAHVGYALINAPWFRLYPLVGVGGAGQSFAVHPKTPQGEDIVGGSFSPVMVFGLGVEVRLLVSRRVLPLVGFRVGFRCRIVECRVSGIELPPQKRAELFFRPIIGLGIRR